MLPPSAIAALRARLSPSAQVFAPGDPGYDKRRQCYNGRFNRRPAVLVYVGSDQDVSETIRFTRAWQIPLSVRAGGTSPAGFSSNDGGTLLDLSLLRFLKIDQAAQVATVGAGLTLDALYQTLGPTGLMVPAGECPPVGMTGLTLGGGFGLLSRSLGLMCDQVIGATVVTAAGQVLTVDASHEPDLFWALRGAGIGNFGVVTSLTLRLSRVPPTVATALAVWSLDQAAAVLREALEYFATKAPPELDAVFSLAPQPKGSPALASLGVYNGPPEAGAKALQAITSLGSPAKTAAGARPFYQFVASLPSLPVGTHYVFKSGFVTGALPASAAERMVDGFAKGPTPPAGTANMIGLELAGGAINDMAPDATAFVHRTSSLLINIVATWQGQPGGTNPPEKQWADQLYGSLTPWFNGEAYQNYPDLELAEWAKAYYGENLPRLRQIKQAYDPDNVFRFPQSIPPP